MGRVKGRAISGVHLCCVFHFKGPLLIYIKLGANMLC